MTVENQSNRKHHSFIPISLSSSLSREIGASATGECPYVLFLGAGASVSSGVPAAATLIEDWKKEIFGHVAERKYPLRESYMKDYRKWRNGTKIGAMEDNFRSWFEILFGDYNEREPELYQILFEYLRKTKESRQSLVEDITTGENVTPSIGYFYLATLLKERIVGCVLTTNFDDLIADTLYKYYDTRPVVCAFEASISNFNNSSTRPKVIKLHGDYLFNNIRNTESEVANLDLNMENKMIELCEDRGLVFIGYGGNDESIMNPILKQMHLNPQFLTKGLHWCIRRKNNLRTHIEERELPKQLRVLRRRFPNRVHIYEIHDFDHFMCDIYSNSDTSTKSCFDKAAERNISKMFIESVAKYKISKTHHHQMATDYGIAASSLIVDSSQAENHLLLAGICWENGFVYREIENDYSKSLAEFKKGISGIDGVEKEFELNTPQVIRATKTKLGCQIGALKSLIRDNKKDEIQVFIGGILETENKVIDLLDVSSNTEDLDGCRYSMAFHSLIYNLVCANCVLVSIKHKQFIEVNHMIKRYIDILSQHPEGLEKIDKLKNDEPDVEPYKARIFGEG